MTSINTANKMMIVLPSPFNDTCYIWQLEGMMHSLSWNADEIERMRQLEFWDKDSSYNQDCEMEVTIRPKEGDTGKYFRTRFIITEGTRQLIRIVSGDEAKIYREPTKKD